jgi:hypothetical protein
MKSKLNLIERSLAMNKNKFNFWFDVILFVFFLVTMVSLLGRGRADAVDQEAFMLQTRIVVHSVAGSLMLMGSAVHIALHWEWIKAVVMRSPKELAKRVRAKRGIDIWLFVFAILCGLTGWMALLMRCPEPVEGRGIISNPFLLSLRACSGLHRLTGTVMFLIMLIHLAQHWKWIVSAPRRYLKISAGSREQQPEQVPA